MSAPSSYLTYQLQAFWNTLWNAPATDIPFIERKAVSRDCSLPEEIVLPPHCWTFPVLPGLKTGDPPLSDALIRNDYLEALRHLFLCIGWDYSHIPRDLGKTLWIYFILILRLHARLPTILQITSTQSVFFSEEGIDIEYNNWHVSAFAKYYGTNRVWALIGTDTIPSIYHIYGCLSIFVVQTPAPQYKLLRWTEKLDGRKAKFVLNPWTLAELICARDLQVEPCGSENSLSNFFHKYGPSARLAYRHAADLERYEDAFLCNIRSISFEDFWTAIPLALYFSLREEHIDSFDRMLVPYRNTDPLRDLEPDVEEYRDRCATPLLRLASRYVGAQIISVLSGQSDLTPTMTKDAATDKLYRHFVRNVQSTPGALDLLDDAIHRVLVVQRSWSLSDTELLPAQNGETQVYRVSDCEVAHRYLCLTDGEADAFSITSAPSPTSDSTSPLRGRLYAFPSYWNCSPSFILRENGFQKTGPEQTSFDGFLYNYSGTDVAVLKAMTTSLSWAFTGDDFKVLKAFRANRIRIIFVVPQGSRVELTVPSDMGESWVACHQLPDVKSQLDTIQNIWPTFPVDQWSDLRGF
ncbi:hypothetical protein H0H81_005895 [Sphagnurus paluster]|uniref:Uncharacterized protein n=1 Tax=Sphagnurus paluster TaxID=117069 RepID=A0A9P7G2N5_9AGAR|nr:hypothetical protein H0H81_005895 [Sphagnurus paluster]